MGAVPSPPEGPEPGQTGSPSRNRHNPLSSALWTWAPPTSWDLLRHPGGLTPRRPRPSSPPPQQLVGCPRVRAAGAQTQQLRSTARRRQPAACFREEVGDCPCVRESSHRSRVRTDLALAGRLGRLGQLGSVHQKVAAPSLVRAHT